MAKGSEASDSSYESDGKLGVQVEIVDAEDRPLPFGEVGRLRYRSPATPSGSYKGDSSEAFRDGWFYPGDLAALDADGFLSLRGRAKDMIIRGGVNIYPGDVESVLLSHPAVADAAVVGVPSPELGEEVAAFVVLKAPVGMDDLVALCRSRLASFKVPKRITVLETLPKNSLGKVLKRELVEMAAG